MRLAQAAFLLVLCSLAAAALPGVQQVGGVAAEGVAQPQHLVLPHMDLPSKSSWPELVGRPCAEAKAAIEAELPGVSCFIVPEHAMVTMDFRTDRVRIFCTADGSTVARPPRIG